MNAVVQNWLDGYLRAWSSNDSEDIRALFTEDATYAGGPFDPEPWVGREGIVEGWLAHQDEPGSWSFEGVPLAYSDGVGVIQGRTDYGDGKLYANLFVVTFAEDGRARSFVEWFMEPGPVRSDQE
ncbi:SnoaL-like domain-containing protein [Microbacterium sp. cf046]|uniref:nuclear transport factor 2 family protein n=1 Tax=Microbacterium sp. cf046 TaxID=1761803 RepID=UPI0008E9230F|nr:nuclear transport factor 2 family protein [Microbacterium sp. cf046]SFS07353.1 SnoaL-like domain-containing protein [Microbacterium sp. cf046]